MKVTPKGLLTTLVVFGALWGFGKYSDSSKAAEAASVRDAMSPRERAVSDSMDGVRAALEAKHEQGENLMYSGTEALKASMKDPESFQVIESFVGPNDDAACVSFRARNSFGGYNVSEAVITRAVTVVREQNEELYVKVFNAMCATHEKKAASARKSGAATHSKPLASGPFVHDASHMNNGFWQTSCKGTVYEVDSPVYFASKASAAAAGFTYEQCPDTV